MGPVLYTIVVFTLGLLRPCYNHVTQPMSELGAVGAPNAIITNRLGFPLLGLLLIAFALGLHLGMSRDEIALTQMNQYYIVVNPHNKLEILCNILDENHIERAIIFCRRGTDTSILADKLRNRGYDAKSLHTGFTQPQRDFVINSFRKGELKLLVATDVAARGLDIQGITPIINYDVPLDTLVYFHRIERTARIGREGTATTLVGYGELTDFNNIKALTKTTIEEIR